MKMVINNIFDLFFGCRHRKLTFPQTARRGQRRSSAGGRQTGAYVVCLNCGKEFSYDWQQMRILNPNERPANARALPVESTRAA